MFKSQTTRVFMYLYLLPTTGPFSFSDFCGHDNSYVRHIARSTQLRANLRSALKQAKHTDGDKDYLSLIKILDEYIPDLRAVMTCVTQGEIQLEKQPQFSWSSALSSAVLNTSSRPSYPSLHAEYAFTLLTYGFTLSNFARSIVASLGTFEQDRTISQTDREAKDEQLKHATNLLTRASSIFNYVSETVLVDWENFLKHIDSNPVKKPPDLSRDVIAALAKLALGDAQGLAIRKLLSKAAFDSNVSPGPPLPKSHPAPGLIAKLHLECASQYAGARALAKTASAASDLSSDVSPDLRHYLSGEAAFHAALGRKWLAIDAGEKGGADRAGDVVGLMTWAKKDLQDLKDGGKSGGVSGITAGEKERKERGLRKERVSKELESVGVWLKHYRKMNDTLHFQSVPSQPDLQSRIPTGILAISVVPFTPPLPAFGPDSLEYMQRRADYRDPNLDSKDPKQKSDTTYAGAGDYF
ncbi:hypothetical protein D9758_003815 [Tetrapyrgos nigripes]|uniref:pH-response regulator protein palC n=1 Tax=Tetrapyrgos nigripes TaxID=182062 RepID=A0A8H5LS65_9AGAR|nr:hypothetical protein D9758_003815 [Tetrapyrgos nigripes]